jgi:uncharacterized membrane protein YphA (DoxX/SURF4 family)
VGGQHVGLLLVRLAIGIVMLAHGWNYAFRGGKLAGVTTPVAALLPCGIDTRDALLSLAPTGGA